MRAVYDDAIKDTGPTRTPDSLDDRFASASGAVHRRAAGPGLAGRRLGLRAGRRHRSAATQRIHRTSGPPPGRAPPLVHRPHRRPAYRRRAADPPNRAAAPTQTPGGPSVPPVPPRRATRRTRHPAGHTRHPARHTRHPAGHTRHPAGHTRHPAGHTRRSAPARRLRAPDLRSRADRPPRRRPRRPRRPGPDTVLDGGRYGTCILRAASVRGDSARFRGELRRDALLTARFGTGEHALQLVAMATGARATPRAHRAAAEQCRWIGRAVGRSHARLADDIRAGRRGDLKSGLHRLTDRSLGRLRARRRRPGAAPGGVRGHPALSAAARRPRLPDPGLLWRRRGRSVPAPRRRLARHRTAGHRGHRRARGGLRLAALRDPAGRPAHDGPGHSGAAQPVRPAPRAAPRTVPFPRLHRPAG
ncbi:hypothetical protein SGLAM104S_07314 [Streptomyces glaucescens]